MSGIIIPCIAQDDYDYDEKDQTYSLFLNSTALVHPKLTGLTIGGEYRWNPNFGINQQIGFIYSDFETDNLNFLNKRKRRGLRTRSELRWYRQSFDRTDKSLYLGLQLRYWYYKENGDYEFCREDCQFQQFMKFDLRQYGVGLGISKGAIKHWGKHFFMDYGITLGAMYRNNKTDLPQDVTRVEVLFNFNSPNPQNFNLIEAYFLFYIKFGYSF